MKARVTMSNGIATDRDCEKAGRLNSLAYTYDVEGKKRSCETLSGNGQYYYGGFSLGNGIFEYSLATDPASNGGNLADVKLLSSTETKGVMEIHFSMLRGSPGFYSTAIATHCKCRMSERSEVGAWGVVTRVPPAFNWVSADDERNWFIGVPTKKGAKVPDSPHEVTVCLDGTRAGNYEDKFIYGQDHANLRAWGWSSVGAGRLNVGWWMMTTMEFSNGGPLKRDAYGVSLQRVKQLHPDRRSRDGIGRVLGRRRGLDENLRTMVYIFKPRPVVGHGCQTGRPAALPRRDHAGDCRGEGVAV